MTVAVAIEVWVTCCLFLLFDLLEMPLISITSVCKGNTALHGLFCDMFDWLMPCSRQAYWIKQSLLVIFENRLHRGLRASQETHGKMEKHCCKINQVLWKSPTGLKPAFPTQQLCNTHSSLSQISQQHYVYWVKTSELQGFLCPTSSASKLLSWYSLNQAPYMLNKFTQRFFMLPQNSKVYQRFSLYLFYWMENRILHFNAEKLTEHWILDNSVFQRP